MASTGSFDDVWQAAAYHFDKNRPLLPMYLHLLVSALFPIYAGSHASLSRPTSAGKPTKKTMSKDEDEEDEEDEDEDTEQKMEGLSNKDAIMFPITAGIVLASLYFLIKKFGADPINLVLGVYFSLIGTYSVGKIINDAWTTVESFITPTYYTDKGTLWKVNNSERTVIAVDGQSASSRKSPLVGRFGRLPLPEIVLNLVWSLRGLTKQKFQVKGYLKDNFDFKVVLTRHNVISSVLGASAIIYTIFFNKPWWLTNLQGFAVSYGALQLMSPTTFGTGSLILTGLFFYDIWAVFFTPLMVTVAKNLDVPIKLVFPRPDEPGAAGEPPVKSYSMLGLGDIVLPGLIIALALRFDLFMFYLRKQKKVQKSTDGDENNKEEVVESVPYVSASGHWGDKFWTKITSPSPSLDAVPAFLTTSFPKPYFTATVVGYVIGMLATLVFMSVFQHAQPALLYLVPSVLISLWSTGLVRGELKQMWTYTEAITGEQIDNEEPESDNKESSTIKEDRSLLQWIWVEVFGADAGVKVTKEEEGTAKAGEDKKSKKATEAKDEKKVKTDGKSSVTDDGAVFSFTITHHKRKADSTSVQKSESTEKDGKAHRVSGSISEDTVVVSTSDLDGTNEGKSRKRHAKKSRVE